MAFVVGHSQVKYMSDYLCHSSYSVFSYPGLKTRQFFHEDVIYDVAPFFSVGRFWRTGYDSLRAVLQNHPSNLPSHTVLDSNLLGFLLVNVETNRCLCSIYPPSTDDETLEVHEKRHILRSYYKHVVGNFFSSKVEGSEKGPSDFTHSAMDTYMTTDTHKCYAMLSPVFQHSP